MEDFQAKWAAFWKKFGSGRKMVLSTSANNRVTSRMMSMVQKDGILYFQTDKTFLKYQQLQENHNVALCMDNIQIEGICNEIGHPLEKEEFISLYKEYFPSSFRKYSSLKNERLFEVIPLYVKCWIYLDGIPFEEIFEVKKQKYDLNEYRGK